MTKPDWGHGPNTPVQMFTEEEIRLVLDLHHYTTGDQGERHGYCSCKYTGPAVDWTPDHFMERLHKLREIAGDGRKANQHKNSA